jgi:pimeloyl-ACP methyl ester carboxylesterase
VRRAGRRLWTGELAELDTTVPPWPGRTVTEGAVRLHVREVPRTGVPAAPAGPAAPDAPDTPGSVGVDGVTAVYVHGLGGSSTNWTDLAGLLAPAAEGLIIDLPGSGRSEPVPGYDYSLTSAADTLARFLAARARRTGAPDRPFHLLGNSMGGAISLLIAARHPELVRSLTLVSPAMPDLRPHPGRLSDPRMALAVLPVIGPRARRGLARLTPGQRSDQLIRLCFAHPERVPAHRIAEVEEELAERDGMPWAHGAVIRATAALMRAWVVWPSRSLWTAARQVAAPALVIWGERDKLVTPRKAPRTTAALPHARLLMLADTGHVAQMEEPVAVARAVLGMWQAAARDRW